MPLRSCCLLLLTLAGLTARADAPKALEFRVTYAQAVTRGPFTGRLYVLTSNGSREPRLGINWFRPEPFFAIDLKNWKPGQVAVVDAKALACPAPLNKLSKGEYTVQAVMDLDLGGRHFGTSPGNGYSKPIRVSIDPEKPSAIELVIDQVARAPVFKETDRVKLFELESKALTAFHGKSIKLRAGVVLPKSFAENPGKKYPVVYEIPGFGGNHFMAFGAERRGVTDVAGVEFLHVMLDPDCRTGHHVFADSANNGPYGKALVEELIPALERKFRAVGVPRGRLLTGHSSGGWSSLWLQVTYPDFFGGTWSTAPDPVDFRDFQQVNIYKPGINLFVDEEGKERPLARRAGRPALWYRGFSDMEVVMGRGGQLASFEAVFSPRGQDGQPRKLWDRKTGKIDPEVARAWQAYDIRLILEKNWKTLGPRLKGKIHVYMGGEDTFYLDGATRLLKESLQKLGSDAVVEIFPGRDHGNLLDPRLRERIKREMAATFRQYQS